MNRAFGIALASLLVAGTFGVVAHAQDTPAATAPAGGPQDPATTPPEPAKTTQELKDEALVSAACMADTAWVLVTGMLVFFMNLGFGCVESGMCRAKNTVNILSKNFIVFAATSVAFLMFGFGLMFGDGDPWFAKEGIWMVSGQDNSPLMGSANDGVYDSINWTGVPLWAKFFFQLVFAGTAATIVSGAVAERIKYHSFIIFTFVMGIAIYPVVGHWIWGGGYLQSGKGFVDFAGSTQVHSIGGWAALAGVIMLGPRLGKYGADGKMTPIPGHSMMAATIGTFILWFGWFGFNPGSTMALSATGVSAAAEVCVTTNTAAAAATLAAALTSWIMMGKPDLGMTLNGSLAGLVAITAPCAFVSVQSSLIIGLVAGVLVVLSVQFFDKIKLDDPVGALSVHLVNGIWGTLSVGLFCTADRLYPRTLNGFLGPIYEKNKEDPSMIGLFTGGNADTLIRQATGVGLTAAYVFVASLIVWAVLKYTVGIRVSPDEERQGLDIGEHGNEAYVGFQMQREN